ncbi:MAG TPA: adenylosuccinate lyase [bacterium (Candidatus Stahlbacteria)]|nr:adenylosuccinate lyase [Candidatus Stahlbacteria bacterium]
MIKRYSTDLSKIWSEESKVERWLEIEAVVAEVEETLGIVPRGTSRGLRRLEIDPDRIAEIEKDIGHDIIAFLLAIKEKIGKRADYIHYGLTSYDLVDTGLSLTLKEVGLVIKEELNRFIKVLKEQIRRYKKLPIMGRTHGVFAEPTLLGLKFLSWLKETERNRTRLGFAIDQISYGKISGAVGTYSQLPPRVEKMVMKRLGLKPEPVSTQVIPRDRHAFFLSTLALISAGLERIALEIRLLSRSEVGELQEPFGRRQRGSSSMPHKQNPILCERICGLARVIRGNLTAAIENISLWHERDISNSSVERIILPDSTILCHYLLQIMIKVIKGIRVNEERIAENIRKACGIYFSQKILLKLVTKGVDKDWVYKKIQQLSFKAVGKGKDLREIVENDREITKILTKRELTAIFSFRTLLKNTDQIYKRALNPSSE